MGAFDRLKPFYRPDVIVLISLVLVELTVLMCYCVRSRHVAHWDVHPDPETSVCEKQACTIAARTKIYTIDKF